jgi:hypothetical protein
MSLSEFERSMPAKRPAPGRQRFGLRELMAFIAGLAVATWLIVPDLREQKSVGPLRDVVFLVVVAALGGLALVGPPLLLTELRRRRRPWGPGKLLWFSSGMATWLLWPPIVYRRAARGAKFGDGSAGVCFAYGTPLMALYVTAALLAGGWLRRRRRRRLALSWRERFGLILGLAWACTGLYVLGLIYTEDF